MKKAHSTLRTRFIVTFVPVVVVLIILIGALLSQLISKAIDKQGAELVRHTEIQLTERLQSGLKIYRQLMQNRLKQILATANALGNSGNFRSLIAKSQHDTVSQVLRQSLESEDLDFATVFDVEGLVLSSVPVNSDDLGIARSYRASSIGSFISSFKAADQLPPNRIGLLSMDKGLLENLGVKTQVDSKKALIGMVVVKFIENDFGDKLGILIAGKLLHQWDQGLTMTRDLSKSAIAVYSGLDPIASIGFPSAISALKPEMISSGTEATNKWTTRYVGDHAFSFICQPLTGIDNAVIGNTCAAISDRQASKVGAVLENLATGLAADIRLWMLVLGSVAVIGLILLSVFFAQKITNPLLSITKAMHRLAENKLDVEIPKSEGIIEVETMASAIQVFKENAIELREAQGTLVRQERLAALGQMSATVSHELRNPLGTIRTSMITIADNTKDMNLGIERAIARIERNIIRCDGIIGELLDYTRESAPNQVPTDADAWLGGVLDEQEVPSGLSLGRDLASSVDISIDQDRFRRIVINLFDNACHAVQDNADGTGRKVDFATRATGERWEMIVTDNGHGIADNELAKIFEPLYSTKSFGVGLGLPVVRKIAGEHGGGIDISSEVGEGTQVTLWLPLSTPKHTEAAAT